MKKVTSIFSGLALSAVLALSVLGNTQQNKPKANENAQTKSTGAQSTKSGKKSAKKSKHTTGTSKQSEQHKS